MITQGLNTTGGIVAQELNAPLLAAQATLPLPRPYPRPSAYSPMAGAAVFGGATGTSGGGGYVLPMVASYRFRRPPDDDDEEWLDQPAVWNVMNAAVSMDDPARDDRRVLRLAPTVQRRPAARARVASRARQSAVVYTPPLALVEATRPTPWLAAVSVFAAGAVLGAAMVYLWMRSQRSRQKHRRMRSTTSKPYR